MDRPRSAWASAAASFTPSPTIATCLPCACSRFTWSTLSLGNTSAITWSESMPTSAATVRATCSLSPVSRIGVRPRPRSRAIASAEVGLTASATTTTPRARPSHPTATAVRPCSAATCTAASRSGGSGWDRSERSPGRPTSTVRDVPSSSTSPWTPSPSMLANPVTAGSAPTCAAAPAATARAIGCSEAFSSAPASRRTVSRSSPSAVITSSNVIWPVVTVPVLSSTIVSTFRVLSSTSGPLIRMPSCAPRPVPTSSAIGVARPRAQGQATISTATAAVKAADTEPPATAQNPNVANAIRITIGTKTPEIRSARRWARALPVCASSTSLAICASWVSAPTRVASTTSRPPALTVAPTTASPTPTSTGTDSPVIMAASTADAPSTIRPSVAIFSPGRTTKWSPTASWSTPIRSSRPLRRTATSLAPSSSRARNAAPARRFDLASK